MNRSRLMDKIMAPSGPGTRDTVFLPTGGLIPRVVNEFWTSAQRQADNLHEISYRACFKPQLPRFFIERFTRRGEMVYDPFMGRGTTPLEAALLGRIPAGCDVNPLSERLLRPRLEPPAPEAVEERLATLDLERRVAVREDLLVFYHPQTLRRLTALRRYLLERERSGEMDAVDRWIRMVAVNRLTGHSPGFLSVYTLPPNQATSVKAQAKINRDRGQTPPERDVKAIILKKSRALQKDLDATRRRSLARLAARSLLLTGLSSHTPEITDSTVRLVVTSPPFLDVVDYAGDNWLRCWFCGIDPRKVRVSIHRKLEDWLATMTAVFRELERVLRPGGLIAFEVGEVRGGRISLDEYIPAAASDAGLEPLLIMVNAQKFTKTSHCWGVTNQSAGTNTNRIVLLGKSG